MGARRTAARRSPPRGASTIRATRPGPRGSAERTSTSPPGPKLIVARRWSRCGASAGASAGTTARPSVAQACQDLGLGRGDRLIAAEQLEMDRADVGDRGHVGLGDRAQLGDLAETAHRHLEHQELGLGRGREDRQRQADLGVEVLGAGVEAEREDRPADVLDRRLAGRAGDPDHSTAELATPGACQRLQRAERVRRRRAPSPPRSAVASSSAWPGSTTAPQAPARAPRPRARRRRRARREGRRTDRRRPTSRESISARAGRPAAPSRTIAAAAPPRRSAPARARSLAGARRRGEPRSSSRATSRSSNGILRPASNSWPCSWPLPAITTASPPLAASSASPIAARRSGSTSISRRCPPVIPARISATIAAGPPSAGCRR